MHVVPRRQTRTVHVPAPARGRELPDLPRPAWLGALQAPQRARPEPVPGLPRLVTAPRELLSGPGRMAVRARRYVVCLRREAWGSQPEREHAPHRALVPELPQLDPWVEC